MIFFSSPIRAKRSARFSLAIVSVIFLYHRALQILLKILNSRKRNDEHYSGCSNRARIIEQIVLFGTIQREPFFSSINN